MKPAVVVNTFDRPESLSRLLGSLAACEVAKGTELVISIDGGGRRLADTLAVARGFEWDHGPAKIIERDDLGLVAHFRACGDLVEEVGPMVMLEDDLVIGPHGLRFAAHALEFCERDERVAGVSLSLPWFDGFRHLPFEPVLDGSSVVYVKLPWFHGMAWTPEQWRSHRGGAGVDPDTKLPAAFAGLTTDEWFPDAVRFLVASDRFWLLPRDAHAVNFGDAGAHFDVDTSAFQRPLAGGRWVEPVILGLDDPEVVTYDEYMEPDPRWLVPHIPQVDERDLTFDLRGLRDPNTIETEWVITSRASRHPIRQWGAVMHPLEQNLMSDVGGTRLTLCRARDVVTGHRSELQAELTVVENGYHGSPPGMRAGIRRRVARTIQRQGRRG